MQRNRIKSALRIIVILFYIGLFFIDWNKDNFVKVQFFRNKLVDTGEAVYITGNIPALGEWNTDNAIKLNWEEGGDNWSAEIYVEAPVDIEYRYFVSTDTYSTDYITWETSDTVSKMSVFPKGNHYGASTSEFDIMSFNIRYDTSGDGYNSWANRKNAATEVIKTNGADFVGIQEALFHQTLDLQNSLPKYSWYGRGRDAGSEDGESAPIFYLNDKWELEDANVFWLSDTPDVPGSMTYGNTLPRMCTWGRFKSKLNGMRVLVYNAHWDYVYQNAISKGAAQVKKHIAQNIESSGVEKVICMGDWNVTPDNEGVRISIEDEVPMKDTFPLATSDATNVLYGTWHDWTGVGQMGKIDYILTTSDFSVTEFKIIHGQVFSHWPSDHFPILAKTSLLN